jgi:hypothetical protein
VSGRHAVNARIDPCPRSLPDTIPGSELNPIGVSQGDEPRAPHPEAGQPGDRASVAADASRSYVTVASGAYTVVLTREQVGPAE